MKQIYVENIRERDLVESSFLVRDKIIGLAKNGKPYMTLKLMDKSGEIEGRVWNQVDEISATFDKNDFVQVAGKASVYMGKMQLIIRDLHRINESAVDIADFLPVSCRNVDEMVRELKTLVSTLQDTYLHRLMSLFLEDDDFMTCYSRAPAAKSMHHAYISGLLEHSLAVAALADDISKRYPDINRDFLIVGALLHDVGKIKELRYDRSFGYTDTGKLLGHIVLGVEIVEDKVSKIEGFPSELAVHLKHLLISHHGKYEFGSPKRPKSMEAVILNYLDDLDSKINGISTHIEREPDHVSTWTQYHKQYDLYFYKGSPSIVGNETKLDETGIADSVIKPEKPSPKGQSSFNNTLEEQLKAKKLDLLRDERQDNEDE